MVRLCLMLRVKGHCGRIGPSFIWLRGTLWTNCHNELWWSKGGEKDRGSRQGGLTWVGDLGFSIRNWNWRHDGKEFTSKGMWKKCKGLMDVSFPSIPSFPPSQPSSLLPSLSLFFFYLFFLLLPSPHSPCPFFRVSFSTTLSTVSTHFVCPLLLSSSLPPSIILK